MGAEEPFEVLHQILADPSLDLVGFVREPLFLAPFRVSNELTRALAHLVAYDGQYSRRLVCDTAGVLKAVLWDSTESRAVVSDAEGALKVHVYGQGNASMVDVSAMSDYGDIALSVRDYYTRQLYTILLDCYDATNHYLKVHQVA
jgi:hypothetical protein